MHRIFSALTLAAVTCSVHAPAQADEPFTCIAERRHVRYTVKLSGASDHRSMSVLDSRGQVTSGRATVYRRGTRFYLPGERGAGFKLGIDDDKASLCFADGGNDCSRCEPIASHRERFISESSCVTTTPRGLLSVTLFDTGEPSPEMLIEDESGELAWGAADIFSGIDTTASLAIGPSEGYSYQMDSGFLCTPADSQECYPCEDRFYHSDQRATALPVTVLAKCTYAGIHARLTEQGGEYFLSLWYNQREEGTGGGAGYFNGPATYLGADRFRYGEHELTLLGIGGELCTLWDGCGPCTDEFESN